jgi:hypothetical protein
MATVIALSNEVSTAPEASRTATRTGGVRTLPTVTFRGWPLKLRPLAEATNVTSAVPEVSPAAAVMTTGPPAASPTTRPASETAAIPGSPLVHVTAWPVSSLPAESATVAVRLTVSPTSAVVCAGAIVTEATGTGFTCIRALPVTLPMEPRITADPGPMAVTSPELETAATDGLPLDQATDAPPAAVPH